MSSEIGADGLTRVSWIPAGGEPVDLTPYVLGVTIPMYRVTGKEEPLAFGLKRTIVFRGRTTGLTPKGYRMLLGSTHPRIRRMHSAYGRRRGRGRW